MAVARFKPSREMSTGAPPTGTTSPRCYSARDAGLREAARVLRTAVDVARFKPSREMSTGAPSTGTTSPNTRCYSARDAGLREAARVLRTATSKTGHPARRVPDQQRRPISASISHQAVLIGCYNAPLYSRCTPCALNFHYVI